MEMLLIDGGYNVMRKVIAHAPDRMGGGGAGSIPGGGEFLPKNAVFSNMYSLHLKR